MKSGSAGDDTLRQTVVWMQTLAKVKNAITGECSIEDNSNFYNRMLFVFRQVKQHYDKRTTPRRGRQSLYNGIKKLVLII
jgi:hypothetical protein